MKKFFSYSLLILIIFLFSAFFGPSSTRAEEAVIPAPIQLSWTKSAGANAYKVQIFNNGQPIGAAKTVTEARYNFLPPSPEGKYSFQVTAVNIDKNGKVLTQSKPNYPPKEISEAQLKAAFASQAKEPMVQKQEEPAGREEKRNVFSRMITRLSALFRKDKNGRDGIGLEKPADKYLLTVNKTGPGASTGNVTPFITGSGTSTLDWMGNTGSASYPPATEITLTASVIPGTVFTGWIGCVANQGDLAAQVLGSLGPNTCTFLMDQAKTVTATFSADFYSLTVSATGTGKVTGVDSVAAINDPYASPTIDCGIDCTESYYTGSSVTLTAVPQYGSTFLGWSGDCVTATSGAFGTFFKKLLGLSKISPRCAATMDAAKTVAASFSVRNYTLTANKTGSGTGTVQTVTNASVSIPGIDCGSDCTETYNAGAAVYLRATPDAGMVATWSGDCSYDGIISVMDANKTCTADFSPPVYNTLTVNVPNPGGTVTVTPYPYSYPYTGGNPITCSSANSPCLADYDSRYNVKLEATLDTITTITATYGTYSGTYSLSGASFNGWGNTDCINKYGFSANYSAGRNCDVAMDTAQTATVQFVPPSPPSPIVQTTECTVASPCSSGYTIPARTFELDIELWGSGGGGGIGGHSERNNNWGAGGGGGGGGGYYQFMEYPVGGGYNIQPGMVLTTTVGVGGSGQNDFSSTRGGYGQSSTIAGQYINLTVAGGSGGYEGEDSWEAVTEGDIIIGDDINSAVAGGIGAGNGGNGGYGGEDAGGGGGGGEGLGTAGGDGNSVLSQYNPGSGGSGGQLGNISLSGGAYGPGIQACVAAAGKNGGNGGNGASNGYRGNQGEDGACGGGGGGGGGYGSRIRTNPRNWWELPEYGYINYSEGPGGKGGDGKIIFTASIAP